MYSLLELINEIVKLGFLVVEPVDKNEEKIERYLVELYYYCLNVSYLDEEINYPSAPDYNYNEIRKIVGQNFPSYGYYNEVMNIENLEQPEIVVGDAIDDLVDIIKDLMEVKWDYDNTSNNNALLNLDISFNNHFGNHLINLLKYIRYKSRR